MNRSFFKVYIFRKSNKKIYFKKKFRYLIVLGVYLPLVLVLVGKGSFKKNDIPYHEKVAEL